MVQKRFAHCEIELRERLGEDVSDQDLDELTGLLQERARQKRRENAIFGDREAARIAAQELVEEQKIQNQVEKRRQALGAKRLAESLDVIFREYKGNEIDGLAALLVGINRARATARLSVDAEQRALAASYLGGLATDIEAQGKDLWRGFVKGGYDRDIARALREMDADEPDLRNIPEPAVNIAVSIRKWQEMSRLDANDAGANIGKAWDYIARQSHDVFKMRQASKAVGGQATRDPDANQKAWMDFIRDKLDQQRTFRDVAPEDHDKFLRSVYDALESGVHLTYRGTGTDAPPPGLNLSRSLAKRMSEGRVLFFKDADAWLDYNEKFGATNLRESIFTGLERTAHNTALMRVLGPNPEDNFAKIKRAILNRSAKGGAAARKKAANTRFVDAYFDEVSGIANVPGSGMFSSFLRITRGIQSMAKLGSAVISAFGDLAFVASTLRFNGLGYTEAWRESLSGAVSGMGPVQRRAFLSELGVALDGLRGAVAHRFDAADALPGKMASLMNLYFKLNGLQWWTDSLRQSAAFSLSHNLARNTSRAYDNLGADLKRTLKTFGITEDIWDVMRARGTVDVEGRQLFTPEAARNIPDSELAKLLPEGTKPTEFRLKQLRQEIERKFKAYFSDMAHTAVIGPDARTNALLRGTPFGIKPGTAMAEVFKQITQFKAFPVAVANRTFGRELYGRSEDFVGFWRALTSGTGAVQGLSHAIVASTALGYLALTTKEMVKGREPRQPEDAIEAWKLLQASMMQGGGLGIYGDFLFGQHNRFGGGIISTFAGPTAGAVEDLASIYADARDGDPKAAKMLRFAINNTPFQNLFWLRWALDYSVLYNIQEQVNPGSLRRTERRIQREQDQEFFFPPSEFALTPLGG